MNILVTGGAGYIGSLTSHELIKLGHDVVIVDNLSKGLKSLIPDESIFYEIDLIDKEKLEEVFKKINLDLVIHFAAYKDIRESDIMVNKYSNNITGTINLLDCMQRYRVPKIIFSSSAGVYGYPKQTPINENHETKPINFYGYTKLVCEQLIQWYSKAYTINYVILRYFNVIGNSYLKYVDPKPSNIIPIILEVLNGKREKLEIFGRNHPTQDGTCVRDYIDINDLVDAHIKSIDYDRNNIFNLGTRNGISLFELIELIENLTGYDLPYEVVEARKGDPSILTAEFLFAKKELGWEPTTSLSLSLKKVFAAESPPSNMI